MVPTRPPETIHPLAPISPRATPGATAAPDCIQATELRCLEGDRTRGECSRQGWPLTAGGYGEKPAPGAVRSRGPCPQLHQLRQLLDAEAFCPFRPHRLRTDSHP